VPTTPEREPDFEPEIQSDNGLPPVEPEPTPEPEPELIMPADTRGAPPTPPDDGGLPVQEGSVSATEGSGVRLGSEWITDGSVPLITIGGTQIPLFAPIGAASWALLNLILSLAGIAFAGYNGLRAYSREKRRESMGSAASAEEEDPVLAAVVTAMNAEDCGYSEKKNVGAFRPACLIATFAAAIVGIFLFILIQETSAPMVLIDWWTVVHVWLAILGIMGTVLLYKARKELVHFDTNGAGKHFDLNVRHGNKLRPPRVPVRQGYAFAGWYRDNKFSSKWDFNDRISDGLTLYAKWVRSPKHARPQPGR